MATTGRKAGKELIRGANAESTILTKAESGNSRPSNNFNSKITIIFNPLSSSIYPK